MKRTAAHPVQTLNWPGAVREILFARCVSGISLHPYWVLQGLAASPGEALMTWPNAVQLKPYEPSQTSAPASSPGWRALPPELQETIGRRAATHDREGTFVAHTYRALKDLRFFSAQIPAELGGGAASYDDIALLLRSMAH